MSHSGCECSPPTILCFNAISGYSRRWLDASPSSFSRDELINQGARAKAIDETWLKEYRSAWSISCLSFPSCQYSLFASNVCLETRNSEQKENAVPGLSILEQQEFLYPHPGNHAASCTAQREVPPFRKRALIIILLRASDSDDNVDCFSSLPT
jgi:hypothetical protein